MDVQKQDHQDERFLRLVLSSQKSIYAFILSLVPNRHDADDILQESLTLMWRKFDTFESEGSFTAWGIGFARNLIMKFYEKHRKSRLRFADDVMAMVDNRATARQDQMEDRVEALKQCITKLPKDDKQLLWMYYEKTVSTKSIADSINASIHAIYRSMARIHNALSRCIHHHMTRQELI